MTIEIKRFAIEIVNRVAAQIDMIIRFNIKSDYMIN